MAKKKKGARDAAEEILKDIAGEGEITRDENGENAPEDESMQDNSADAGQIAALTKKCDEYLLMAQRVQADFDNYKRRNEAAKSQAYNDGTTDAMTAMLPVMDNFDRAIASIPVDEASKPIMDGVILVKKQLETAFQAKGISEISSEKGEKFDPELHNAVMTAAAEEGDEPGTIAATFQKGYKMNEKVIRYAMVSVFSE